MNSSSARRVSGVNKVRYIAIVLLLPWVLQQEQKASERSFLPKPLTHSPGGAGSGFGFCGVSRLPLSPIALNVHAAVTPSLE